MTASLRISDVFDVAHRALGVDWRDDPDVEAEVRRAAARCIKMLRNVASREGRPGRMQRAAEFQVLRSREAMFSCLLLGWPEKVEPVGMDAARQMASELNPRQDCGEPITTWKERKVDGGYRQLVKFGPKRRALQRLVREVLQASHGHSPFDFCRKGRGPNKAMLAMKKAVQARGARWFTITDIKDCYGSFHKEAVARLIPLPKAVVENSILIPDTAEVIIEGKDHSSGQAARRGIPQGSLVSPFVAAFLLHPVVQGLKGEVTLIHGDDIVTGSRTKSECEANANALADALSQHPAGPLLMKHNWIAKMGSPVECLGYRMVWRPRQFGGGIRFRPSDQAFGKFYQRTEARLIKGASLEQMEERSMTMARNWAGGFKLWDRTPGGELLVWLELAQYVIPCARRHLKKAAGMGIYAPGYISDIDQTSTMELLRDALASQSTDPS